MSYRRSAIAAAVALLAVPASASAATRDVYIGVPKANQKSFSKLSADVNDFFPHGTTIHAGDSIRFRPAGVLVPHDVYLPKKGGGPRPLLTPTGQKIAGATDAAGAPFWFNGQDQIGFNPALGKVNFGKTLTYSGARDVSSGLSPQNVKPMTVRFTKAGTYTFFCDLHLGMKGTVRVVSQRHRIPSVAAHAKTVKTQAARDLTLAKSLANKQAAPGTVDLGEAGKHGVEYFGMVPATTTVPVGSTLSFRITSASYEVHTATFGPGDPAKDPSSYLGQLSASLEAFKPLDAALYPSDPPPAGPATLTPTLHGNGFWNSSPLDPVAATPPPQTSAVRFGAPGTYQFYCLIHPYMHGTVVVQ